VQRYEVKMMDYNCSAGTSRHLLLVLLLVLFLNTHLLLYLPTRNLTPERLHLR
jgi:hypothetical protein